MNFICIENVLRSQIFVAASSFYKVQYFQCMSSNPKVFILEKKILIQWILLVITKFAM